MFAQDFQEELRAIGLFLEKYHNPLFSKARYAIFMVRLWFADHDLFVPQRDQGVYAHGAARGQVSSNQTDGDHYAAETTIGKGRRLAGRIRLAATRFPRTQGVLR